MPDPISTLALATGGAFLGKFVGPAAEHLGKLALERAQQLGAKATALLAAMDREPQPVEPKLLVPLVQAASLESDPVLAEKWAALLANAADPVQRVVVQPAFADILRQLTPLDAQVLDTVAIASAKELAPIEGVNGFAPTPTIKEAIGGDDLSAAFAISVDNLVRLRLCITVAGLPNFATMGKENRTATDYELLPTNRFMSPTNLGLAFLAAVTPPTA